MTGKMLQEAIIIPSLSTSEAVLLSRSASSTFPGFSGLLVQGRASHNLNVGNITGKTFQEVISYQLLSTSEAVLSAGLDSSTFPGFSGLLIQGRASHN